MSSPVSSCCSDFDAAETFASALMSQIDSESVRNMAAVQRDMLSRFEKTNEMLINFNILSANRFAVTSAQFRQNTQLLYDMKKDLDSIFKRIRLIKHKLAKTYPEAFKASDMSSLLEDDEEESAEVAKENKKDCLKSEQNRQERRSKSLENVCADNSSENAGHLERTDVKGAEEGDVYSSRPEHVSQVGSINIG